MEEGGCCGRISAKCGGAACVAHDYRCGSGAGVLWAGSPWYGTGDCTPDTKGARRGSALGPYSFWRRADLGDLLSAGSSGVSPYGYACSGFGAPYLSERKWYLFPCGGISYPYQACQFSAGIGCAGVLTGRSAFGFVGTSPRCPCGRAAVEGWTCQSESCLYQYVPPSGPDRTIWIGKWCVVQFSGIPLFLIEWGGLGTAFRLGKEPCCTESAEGFFWSRSA